LLYADALGLAFFSIVGVQIAQAGGLSPFPAAIMGAITGCAGGLIRDVLVAEVPLIFRQTELYVTACAAGIAVYLGLAAAGLAPGLASISGMAVIALVRLASILWSIRLPILQLPADGDRSPRG